jgi:hypothetical protein
MVVAPFIGHGKARAGLSRFLPGLLFGVDEMKNNVLTTSLTVLRHSLQTRLADRNASTRTIAQCGTLFT